jgi:hypothetical protein
MHDLRVNESLEEVEYPIRPLIIVINVRGIVLPDRGE